MSYIDLRRRLSRIEAERGGSVPTRIFADCPLTAAEMTDALTNWQALVADGRVSVSRGVLCILGPEMACEAWQARYATEHYSATPISNSMPRPGP